MKWKNKVKMFLEETKDRDRVAGGYKAMATRLTNDLGKSISPSQVKAYLKKMEKEGTASAIRASAKGKRDSDAYNWQSKYNVMKASFMKK